MSACVRLVTRICLCNTQRRQLHGAAGASGAAAVPAVVLGGSKDRENV